MDNGYFDNFDREKVVPNYRALSDTMKRVFVKNFIICGIDNGYQSMYRRSYCFNNLNGRSIGAIQDIFNRDMEGGGKIMPTTLSQELPWLMSLKNAPGTMIEIPNGWNERRFRFILQIEVPVTGPYTRYYIIQGFTDYLGATQTNIDPNLRLFINSISEAEAVLNKVTGQYTYNIGTTYQTLKDISREVHEYNVNLYSNRDPNQLSLLRPTDYWTSQRLNKELRYDNGEGFNVGSIVGVGEYTPYSAQTSLRGNQDPNVYLGRIINSYQTGRNVGRYSQSYGDETDIYRLAEREVPEPILAHNTFLGRLQDITGETSPSVLTYGQLMAIDPGVEKVKHIILNSGETYSYRIGMEINDTNDTMETMTPSELNVRVLELNNSITSAIINSGLTSAEIYVKSDGIGVPIVEVLGAKSLFSDGFVIPGSNTLRDILSSLIIPKFTRNGECPCEMKISCDTLKDTLINLVDYNYGLDQMIYKFPTFADSLYSPVIGTQNDKMVLNNDLDTIFREIVPGKIIKG